MSSVSFELCKNRQNTRDFSFFFKIVSEENTSELYNYLDFCTNKTNMLVN